MPEGDTVYKLAAYLRPVLRGHRLCRGRLRAYPDSDLAGAQVEDVYARGKHLFIALDDDRQLRSHLGMYGSWHSYAPGESWLKPKAQAGIVLETEERVFVCFNPKQVEILRGSGVRRRTFDRVIGPDLLARDVHIPVIVARLRALMPTGGLLIDALLDQRVACGIGNVFKSETLFLTAWHPQIRIAELADSDLEAVYRCAAELLAANTRGGPRITRRANDEAGRLWVYGRTGRLCHRCETRIVSAHLGRELRPTFWCPRCQVAGSLPRERSVADEE